MGYNGSENRWKGYILGAMGGMAGLAARHYFMKATSRFVPPPVPREKKSMSKIGQQYREGESPTAALGRIIYRKLTGSEPQSEEMKKALSTLVHWEYGGLMGAMYGVFRGRGHGQDLAGGASFGLGVFALTDLVALPLLGLTESPEVYPPAYHAQMLGAHVVYGMSMACTTQMLKCVFAGRRETLPADTYEDQAESHELMRLPHEREMIFET